MVERKNITDKEIFDLYNNGWSINDIVMNHKTSIRRVRSCLQNKGIDTSKYRSASIQVKEIVLRLVELGVSYKKISDTVDISIHLIRQILRDNKTTSFDLRVMGAFSGISAEISDSDWLNFYELYESGTIGFMKCAQKCGFSVSCCIEAAMKLSERDVYQHREKLYAYIVLQKDTGLSATSVSKQLGISTAIVKNIFNQEN